MGNNESVWAAVLDMIPDVERWNRNLGEFKRLTEEYGPECRAFILAEAERRGYLWSKATQQYVKVKGIIDEASEVPEMLACDRGASTLPKSRSRKRVGSRSVSVDTETD